MKYVTYSLAADEKVQQVGVLRGTRVFNLGSLLEHQWAGAVPGSLLELIQAGPLVWQRIARLAEEFWDRPSISETGHPLDQVRLHAPIPRPLKNVFCLGLNYTAHMEEAARARGRQLRVPEVPVFFTKPPTAVSGPYDPIPWDPAVTEQVDYEVELGVVIGVGGKNIPRAKALEHVFGYTVVNDVSARDLQQKHLQWFKGKSLDGFCPMGPSLVTADEFGDPQKKQVSLRVNGVTKQSSTTAQMIFPVSAIIEFLSQGMTLEAGDIISTGTPEGVGLGRTPPEYLRNGDWVETEVEGIGVLRNQVVAESPPASSP